MKLSLLLGLFGLTGTGFAIPLSFPECPAVGNDTTGCELLITVTAVNSSGAATAFTVATSFPDLGPFDGDDDTLIGITNTASTTLRSIFLTGGLGSDIFDFDGDGPCTGVYSPGPTLAQCGLGSYTTIDPEDYESAGATFSNYSNLSVDGTLDSGVVNVNLATGQSTWFALEEQITASELAGGVPEPGSLGLVSAGLVMLAGVLRLRRNRA